MDKIPIYIKKKHFRMFNKIVRGDHTFRGVSKMKKEQVNDLFNDFFEMKDDKIKLKKKHHKILLDEYDMNHDMKDIYKRYVLHKTMNKERRELHKKLNKEKSKKLNKEKSKKPAPKKDLKEMDLKNKKKILKKLMKSPETQIDDYWKKTKREINSIKKRLKFRSKNDDEYKKHISLKKLKNLPSGLEGGRIKAIERNLIILDLLKKNLEKIQKKNKK
tara:strand:- start:21044 stop:21694 length:651 start_codon:yes stop_codon:yes gene_type:complete